MSASTIPYIGSKISLISNSEIRYEGILYTINTQESTIALQSVRSFGTEGRKLPEIPPSSEIYDFIIFRGQDIKDLTVLEGSNKAQGPQQRDPAVVSVNQRPATQSSGGQQSSSGGGWGQNYFGGGGGGGWGQQQSSYGKGSGAGGKGGKQQQSAWGQSSWGGWDSGWQQDSKGKGSKGGGKSGAPTLTKGSYGGDTKGKGGGKDSGKNAWGQPIKGASTSKGGDKGKGGKSDGKSGMKGGKAVPAKGSKGDSKGGKGAGGKGGDGGKGKGRSPSSNTPIGELLPDQNASGKKEFAEDFDISQANEKFTKVESVEETTGDDVVKKPLSGYDKVSSFFDNISCEATERAGNAKREKVDREKAQELDKVTFGDTRRPPRPIWSRRGKGKGGRGY